MPKLKTRRIETLPKCPWQFQSGVSDLAADRADEQLQHHRASPIARRESPGVTPFDAGVRENDHRATALIVGTALADISADDQRPRALRERGIVARIARNDNQAAALILASAVAGVSTHENRPAALSAQAAGITAAKIVAHGTGDTDRPAALLDAQRMPRVPMNYQCAAGHFRATFMRRRAVNLDPATTHPPADALESCQISGETQNTILERTLELK